VRGTEGATSAVWPAGMSTATPVKLHGVKVRAIGTANMGAATKPMVRIERESIMMRK
jgi:hypothetical protein